MNPLTKPAAQLSLEHILERNKAEAERLTSEARKLLAENSRIDAEMHKILSEPPPTTTRLVEAFKNGTALALMELENARTTPPKIEAAPDSTRLTAEREVLYAALAIVRSWQRRHKKTFHAQERELMKAVEKLTWEKPKERS